MRTVLPGNATAVVDNGPPTAQAIKRNMRPFDVSSLFHRKKNRQTNASRSASSASSNGWPKHSSAPNVGEGETVTRNNHAQYSPNPSSLIGNI